MDEIQQRTRKLQNNLMKALGGSLAVPADPSQEIGKKDSKDAQESRSRISSILSSEATRVIEQIDIETPKMNQEMCEDYIRWASENS